MLQGTILTIYRQGAPLFLAYVHCDHWTSVNNDNYLGVTVHFIDNAWKLRSFALEVNKTEARHTAENCAEEFLNVSNRWEIRGKLTTLGTDSARSMLAAARLLPF